MTSLTQIDVLTAALEGADPCGPDLVFSLEFDRLSEMRRQDDASLAQGEWVAELKRADWPGVMRLCEELLGTRTKDLRLAAWWAEAAAHARGYAGLADGLSLYAALCRQHWEAVHPQPDGDDAELRVGSVSWLLAQVKSLALSLPVLQSGDSGLALADIDSARQRSPAATAAAATAAAESGRPPPLNMDMVTRAQRATPNARVMALVEGVRRLPEALAELQTVIDERLGADGPGFAPARDAVQAAKSSLERLAREMGALPAGVPDAPGPVAIDATSAETSQAPAGVGGPLTTRAQALAQLRAVADFYRRTEPHSPVAYLVERAARWGEMPLHEWLRSVLKEEGALSQLEELLGVKAPPAQPPEGS
jgi:type VI secretion system protein ImpA